VNAPLYTTEILRLAASLPEPVTLERQDGRAELRSPTCGSRVAATVQMEEGRIAMLSLEVQACAFGQAASAIAANGAAGRSRQEVAEVLEALQSWLAGERDAAPDWPQMEALAPARSRKSRHGAILLPLRAVLAAMDGTR
jgi:NifU-like protein involved in Fe-S cluster formation